MSMHARDAQHVDDYLCRLDHTIETAPEGVAVIRDDGDDGEVATIAYTVRAEISHTQMLDLLEETR